MIPNIIHFIWIGEKFLYGKDFSFIHFLAIYTAWKVNTPEKIYFHYEFEPTGGYWEQIKPHLHLNKITAPTEIFGNQLKHVAHKADVLRLEILMRHGGIYLDIDVVSINPFTPLLEKSVVMGMEPGVGLCNAVILAKPNSEFLSHWHQEYESYTGDVYNYHCVVLSFILSRKFSSLVHVENKNSFFYPMYNDLVHLYLWHFSIPFKMRVKENIRNTKRFIRRVFKNEKGREATFHINHGREWHYNKLRESFCIHLWESVWWEKYLKDLNPEAVLNGTSNFSLLVRKILTREELLSIVSS